ncbi:hypothetical protein K431DRAFT_289777 [Polychaeton citri CBS 116435]|uniref:RNA exonuclease 4 n=1 Tax=Polychaeton citri CBS 116435 TaxID=1314669 RepID=A0A9P4Q009_9PEZI|nr:hypothetical protein K431DRAFT_289777 [Polychaeton citri CBS 116435]
MSRLDPAQLSSNWKKLQEKLGNERKSQPGTIAKRKRPAEQQDGRNVISTGGLKKRKTERPLHKPTRYKPGKMGGSISCQIGEQSTETNQNGQTIARPAPRASASSTTQTLQESAVDEHKDIPNSGLIPNRKAGKYVALDCEMVGTGPPPHLDHVLARASLVNFHGEQIYDSYVLPPPRIVIRDYRTHVSGITPDHVRPGYARTFQEVQAEVMALVEGRMLVGHALKNDLQVLLLNHPKRDLRDTSRHPKYRIRSRGKPPALRDLARDELGLSIHGGAHSSVEDARVTMALFKKEKAGFEEENRRYYGPSRSMISKEHGKVAGAAPGIAGAAVGNDSEEESDDEEDEDEAVLDSEDNEEQGTNLLKGAPSRSTGPKAKKKKKKKSRTRRK